MNEYKYIAVCPNCGQSILYEDLAVERKQVYYQSFDEMQPSPKAPIIVVCECGEKVRV